MPGVMVGRTERVAWGITNNICSQRDLYQEKTDPAHPGCFLFDGRWEPARERQEIIRVKRAAPVALAVRSSRNGPIVDDVLPAPVRGMGPVALRWLGAEPCGWLTALIDMNQARSAADLRDATRPWSVPTFNVVYADADGHTGHQSTGRIPIRRIAERGYRPGWDPRHQWDSVIAFEAMPHQIDPPRGFAVTANNRLASDDFPYPLSGCWSSGHRARRIRERLESSPQWSVKDTRKLQLDIRSGRAAACAPALVKLLTGDSDTAVQGALRELAAWDYQVETDSVAATLFNAFWVHWCRTVMAEHLPVSAAEFAAATAGGLATTLLAGDAIGWFTRRDRRTAARAALVAALDELATRLGPDMAHWRWGRLHTLVQKHFLSGIGELGQLLDRSGAPVRGDVTCIASSTPDANYAAYLGASYRMVADLSDAQRGIWAVDVAGVSGHPGSPHYDDQIATWSAGGHHYLSLTAATHAATLTLVPASADAR
jgi:penicillin amidase